MIRTLVAIAAATTISTTAGAADCWELSNLKGVSAFPQTSTEFVDDKIVGRVRVCFRGDHGVMLDAGSELALGRFGDSTLVRTFKNGLVELVEVIQVDRANGTGLLTRSKVQDGSFGVTAAYAMIGRAEAVSSLMP